MCQSALPGLDPTALAELIRSRFSEESVNSDETVDLWLEARLRESVQRISRIPLHAMTRWQIDPGTGNISHDTGRFFSFTGIRVRHRSAAGELEWDQPIIDQPEVGILGILAKNINGILHLCLQAKEEPGNINSVQLSPSIQATYSNYTCAHGGNKPLFIDRFLAAPKDRILFAKLQTEDGGRFLFKSNRNMIVRVGESELEELPEGFIWLTMRQIARLMKSDNLVHATTRSVMSSLLLPGAGGGLDFNGDTAGYSAGSGSLGESIQWLDDQKAANHMLVKRKGLNNLSDWDYAPDGKFRHKEGRFFRISGIEVESVGREVAGWHQPVFENSQPGIIGLLMKVVDGRRMFLLQTKAEPGNRGAVQIGPTVQFSQGNYTDNPRLSKPFLFEEFASPQQFTVVADSIQSEEGARFLKEANCHRVLMLPAGERLDHPEEYRWMCEDEVRFFLYMGETMNSCVRSIIACLL